MPMHEAYQRILKFLNLEKHLTARQIAEVMYPGEGEKAYQRVSKNLNYLKTKSLLKSKSYGFAKENLWSLRQHPIIKELDLSPPRGEVHTFKYDHEKLCADIFVLLYSTGNLYSWGQKKLSGIIPDRYFEYGDRLVYLELERGTQDQKRIIGKLQAYKKWFRETGEKFHVWFVVIDDKTYQMINGLLQNEPRAYRVYTLDKLISELHFHSK